MPSYTSSVLLAGLAAFATPSIAGYALEDDYSGSNFFNKMQFFTDADPTHGFVKYVDQATAQQNGLIHTGSTVFMGVDNTTVTSSGRQSVRVTSNKAYNHGLVILDVAHMPVGCGTWPAFWMTGPNWPNNGEIDILEGVNDQASNFMTLHTGPGCSIQNDGTFTGSIQTPNCDINAAGQSQNQGCGIAANNQKSYGTGLNAVGGGVFATEWTSSAISIWFFPRGSIPSDALSSSPKPSTWGRPAGRFSGNCDIDSKFHNQQIVFDTTFCGDWAGNVWGQSATCSAKASSCQAYVGQNPQAFSDAYWSINSLKVYQSNGAASDSNPAPAVSSSAAAPPVQQPTSQAPLPTSTAETPVQATAAPSNWDGNGWAGPAQTSAAAAPAPAPSNWNGHGWPGKQVDNSPADNNQSNNNNNGNAAVSDWNGEGWAAPAATAAPAPPAGDGNLNWDDYNLFPGSHNARRHARHLLKHRRNSH